MEGAFSYGCTSANALKITNGSWILCRNCVEIRIEKTHVVGPDLAIAKFEFRFDDRKNTVVVPASFGQRFSFKCNRAFRISKKFLISGSSCSSDSS
jgi:hypothetical protein